MKSFDTNILIYAHRGDQPDHEFYRNYLEKTINEERSFALSHLIVSAFIRIVTQPRFPNGPTDFPQALAMIESLTSQDHCHLLGPGYQHVELLTDICRKEKCIGKLVADAQHSAIAIEHACTWVTRDRDFERFTNHGLRLEIIEP